MYSQGRSSAMRTAVSAILIVFLLSVQAQAARYDVGGSSGWGFSTGNWASGKNFKAGDILIFNYDPSLHNVVEVDANGYKGCSSSAKAKTYSSGKDRIKLVKGKHYFICSFAGHCGGGVKIEVNAL
ncbi:OLC1v1006801C1 [Oldenlandia corymbosa var. corymbosa]|uniref:Basic blue protein n=1 Tax=Oldenlandia corymbosa var. corymbosa TaxID=529605 RepID=A0AAV1DI72_OLDCO|nr:OLC1v1006801C1 [Oldenlandia corymbosa var. corymbosa]